MNHFRSFAVLSFVLLFNSVASASLNPGQDDHTNIDQGFAHYPGSIGVNGIYSFSHDSGLAAQEVIRDGEREDSDGALFTFKKDDHVAIEFLSSGRAIVSFLLAEDEQGQVPDRIVVSAQELSRAGLGFVSLGDSGYLAKNFAPPEEEEQVASRGGHHRSARRLHFGGNVGCVAYVKRHVGWPGGTVGNGVGMTRALHRVMHYVYLSNCSNPPVGAVASWSGGRHGFGHTAVWDGGCWRYDQPLCDPGSGYHFLNCVAPPSYASLQ